MRIDRREPDTVTDEEVSAYLDGALSKRRRRRIESLLMRDDELRRTLEEYRRLRELAEQERVPEDPRPGEQYRAQVMDRIAAERQPRPVWKVRARWAGVTATVILVFAGGWWLAGRPGIAPSDVERPPVAVAPAERPAPHDVETTREPSPQIDDTKTTTTPAVGPSEAAREPVPSDVTPPPPATQESASEEKLSQFPRTARSSASPTIASTAKSVRDASGSVSVAESPARAVFRLPYRVRLVAGTQVLEEARLTLPFRIEFPYLDRRYRVGVRREEGDRMAFETEYRVDDSGEVEGSLERYVDLATTPSPRAEPVRFLVAQPAGQRPRVYMELLPLDTVQTAPQPTNTPKGPDNGDKP